LLLSWQDIKLDSTRVSQLADLTAFQQ